MWYNPKSMFRRLYLLLLISVLAFGVRAQSQLVFSHDTLTFFNVSIDSTAQVLVVSDTLKNLGGGVFSGTVYLNGRINGGIPLLIDSFALTNMDTVPSSDSLIRFNLPVGATSSSFVSGPNGVVIWPIYHQQPFTDSLYIKIFVTHVLGIDEAPLAKMYIIQNSGSLNVQFGDAPNIVKQVSFYDLSGRLLYSGSEQQAHSVPDAGWSTGVYICEITTWRGERRAIKFILQ